MTAIFCILTSSNWYPWMWTPLWLNCAKTPKLNELRYVEKAFLLKIKQYVYSTILTTLNCLSQINFHWLQSHLHHYYSYKKNYLPLNAFILHSYCIISILPVVNSMLTNDMSKEKYPQLYDPDFWDW